MGVGGILTKTVASHVSHSKHNKKQGNQKNVIQLHAEEYEQEIQGDVHQVMEREMATAGSEQETSHTLLLMSS